MAASSSLPGPPPWLPSSGWPAWSLGDRLEAPGTGRGVGCQQEGHPAPLSLLRLSIICTMGCARGRRNRRQTPLDSHLGSVYMRRETQLDSSQDRELSLQNLALRDVPGWEDTWATCAGGSPRAHTADRWLATAFRGRGQVWGRVDVLSPTPFSSSYTNPTSDQTFKLGLEQRFKITL